MAERRLLTRRRIRRAIAAGGIHLLFHSLGRLPRRAALLLTRLLGRSAWLLDRRGRHTALENLVRAFGDRVQQRTRVDVARSAYINLTCNLADLARLPRITADEVSALVTEGQDTMVHLHRAAKRGKGAILLTPHLGNWELLTAYLASRGAPVHFVGREPYDDRLDRLYEAVRCTHGGRWIRRGGAFERILEVLGAGELVVLLIDQDTRRVRGTFVEFFDEPAWTPTGPAALHRLTGAELLPGALIRTPGDSYRLVIMPPLRTVSTGSEEWDDHENTRRASRATEALIERFPAQWVWFHRRWATRPPADWRPPGPPGPDLYLTVRSPVED